MVVYLDILLLENFFVNMFLLTVTMQSLRRKVPLKKLILASAVGSLYVITMVYPFLNFFSKTPFKILVAVLMNFIVIGAIKEFKLAIKSTFIFIFYSMVLAGLCFYLSISKGDSAVPEAMIYNFSYKKLILSIMIIYIVVIRLVVYIRDRKILKRYIFSTEIYINQVETTIDALLDTGNELSEPVTNLPVMIVERESFKGLNLKEKNVYNIPYSVVGSYGRSLQGIRPDKVIVNCGNSREEKNLIVAFTSSKLSEHGEYKGLLPRGVV